ncbi:hypothetical protein JOD43_002949 [Pullulanibacillus pueri]|nr:hypothetical protein [Pullulanibacillus pueri]
MVIGMVWISAPIDLVLTKHFGKKLFNAQLNEDRACFTLGFSQKVRKYKIIGQQNGVDLHSRALAFLGHGLS